MSAGCYSAFTLGYLLVHMSFDQVEKLVGVLILFTSFMFAFSLVVTGLDYDDLNAADVRICSAQNLTLYMMTVPPPVYTYRTPACFLPFFFHNTYFQHVYLFVCCDEFHFR